ncbi:MAG: hypothetical protein ACT4O3_09340 [Elusimicrobiota bacterium]
MSQPTTRPADVRGILNEIEKLVERNRAEQGAELTIKDYRRLFDQESGKMNQAIFNDQNEQIRETCMRTVAILVEILARS